MQPLQKGYPNRIRTHNKNNIRGSPKAKKGIKKQEISLEKKKMVLNCYAM